MVINSSYINNTLGVFHQLHGQRIHDPTKSIIIIIITITITMYTSIKSLLDIVLDIDD